MESYRINDTQQMCLFILLMSPNVYLTLNSIAHIIHRDQVEIQNALFWLNSRQMVECSRFGNIDFYKYKEPDISHY